MSDNIILEAKQKYTPTPEDARIIAALSNHQDTMDLSDTKFCKEHLSITSTVWLRVKSGEYWQMVQDGSSVMAQLGLDLDRLQNWLDLRDRFANLKFVPTTESRAVFAAIEACLLKPTDDPERVVVYLAPTRGGKSALCKEITGKWKNARYVQSHEGWERSYFTCLKDLGVALGAFSSQPKKYLSKQAMEKKLIDSLAGRRMVLAIDEAEFFGRDSLNLIKYMLNSTNVVIVLCVIPEAYDEWQGSFPHESAQILARTHSIHSLEPISADTAAKFLRDVSLEQPKVCAQFAADAANDFGHFSCLGYIQKRLQSGAGPGDVAKLVNQYRKDKRKPDLVFAAGAAAEAKPSKH